MDWQDTPDKDVLRAIKRGDFRDQYLVYSRRSIDEANSQKNSLSFQSRELQAFNKRTGRSVANIDLRGFCKQGLIAEKHSRFKESGSFEVTREGLVQYEIERPKFQQLVQFLNANYFAGVVALCWDRISRNQGDDTVVSKLMQRGVDFQFAYVTYEDTSSGMLHMDVDGVFARHHSRVTSEKVQLALNAMRTDGKFTSKAPIGYLNNGTADHKPFDPNRAPILKELFELYATGDWSLSDLCRHANRQGFTTVPRRRRRSHAEILDDDADDISEQPLVSRPLTPNHLAKILRNPFYVGSVKDIHGCYIPSTSHEALVTTATFAKVQEQLGDRRVSVRYTEKLDHPFRGFMRCAKCRRVYTPYEKKGILYYNARCAPECSNSFKNCNLAHVIELVRQLTGKLIFSDQELQAIDAAANTETAQLKASAEQAAIKRNRERAHLQEKLTYLNANQLDLLASGAYTPKALADERSSLEAQLTESDEQTCLSSEKLDQLLQQVRTVSERLSVAQNLFEFAKPHEIERFAKTLVSELFIDQDTFDFSLRSGLQPLFARTVSNGAPLGWISELSLGEVKEISNALEEISKLHLKHQR